MAQLESVFAVDKLYTETILTGAAVAAAINIGANKRFAIWSDQAWYFKMGGSTIVASASDMPVPAGMVLELATGSHNPYISAFNNSGSTMHISLIYAKGE